MSEKNEKLWTFVGVVLACCALVLCLSVLVTAFKLGTALLAWWVVVAFQVLLTVCGTAVSLAFTWLVVGWGMSSVSERVEKLARQHREALAKLQKRTPTVFACACLASAMALVYADKVFKEEATVVFVTILLTFLFWVGNEFMIRESKRERWVGWAFWLAGILVLPAAVVLERHMDIPGVWAEFCKIPFRSRLAIALMTMVNLAVPFAAKKD